MLRFKGLKNISSNIYKNATIQCVININELIKCYIPRNNASQKIIKIILLKSELL